MTEESTIEVRKITAHLPVSAEVLMDAGLIPDTRPKQTKRQLRKWRRQAWWRAHRPHVHLGPCDEGEDW